MRRSESTPHKVRVNSKSITVTLERTSEPSVRRCGEEVGRLRNLRDLSRARFVRRLFEVFDSDDPIVDHISEEWLKRLENGHMVKLHRATVEGIAKALRCTPQERVRLLLHADRSVFTYGPKGPDEVAEILTYVMDQVYVEAREVLADALKQRRARDLDKAELLELVAKALQLVSRQ